MKTQDIIRKRRLELGLTLKDVADALGVAESTVSRYETNYIQTLKTDKLKALANVLKTTPANLLGYQDLPTDYLFETFLIEFRSASPEQQKAIMDYADYIFTQKKDKNADKM